MVEKIEKLNRKQLKQAQMIIDFFHLLGFEDSDIDNLLTYVKATPKIIKTMNDIVIDQNNINQSINQKTNQKTKENTEKLMEELLKKSETLNVHR